jgi:putative ABC transport system permease protein
MAGVDLLVWTMGPPPGLPRVWPIAFDGAAAVILVVLAVGAGLAIGALPALVAIRRTAARGGAGTAPPVGGDLRSTRIRGTLVAGQIAMALVLLVVAGLFVNMLVRTLGRDLNIEPDGLASFQIVVEPREFVKRTGSAGFLGVFELSPLAAETIDRVHRRLRMIPGIERVGGLTYQPVNSLVLPRLQVWPAPASTGSTDRVVSRGIATFLVTPDVFAALRTPIRRGREVSDADSGTAPPVVVINESAERLLFPGRQAVGARLMVDLHPNAPAREVVGVVADVPTRRRLDVEPIVYLPSRQMPATFHGGGANFFGHMTFVARHSGDDAALIAAARRAIADVEPGRPLVEAGIVRRWLDGRIAELSNYVAAILAFGLVAAVLASMGVYGITSFAVAARTREIGIRRALGADARAVIAVVGWRSLRLTLAGLSAGLVIALGATRFVSSQLVGVSATDPVTFAAAGALLAAIGLAACLIPARRALSVEPATVLRND